MRILKSFGELLIISKQLKHSAKEINHIKLMWKIDTFEEYLQAVTKLRILIIKHIYYYSCNWLI